MLRISPRNKPLPKKTPPPPSPLAQQQKSSPSLHHNDMISMLRLDLGVFRVRRRARLEVVGRFLKRRVQRASDFPAQTASCSCSSQRSLARGVGGEPEGEE